jgi:hypothetical protein
MAEFYDILSDSTKPIFNAEAPTHENNRRRGAEAPAPITELFTRWRDTMTPVYLGLLLENAWAQSPEDTLKVIFYVRDCRGGRGLHDQFYMAVKWLLNNHPDTLLKNLKNIPTYGYWKDFLNLWPQVNELVRSYIVIIFANQLKADMVSLSKKEPVTLAGKWAPSAKGMHDKTYGFVKILLEQLRWTKAQYTHNIGKLREALKVTERFLCQGRSKEVDIFKVPSVCRRNLTNSFIKWCTNSYMGYILAEKRPKMSHLQKFSHRLMAPVAMMQWIVSECMSSSTKFVSSSSSETRKNDELDLLWRESINHIKSSVLVDTIPHLQVSGLPEHAKIAAMTMALAVMECNGGLALINGKNHNLVAEDRLDDPIHVKVQRLLMALADDRSKYVLEENCEKNIDWQMVFGKMEELEKTKVLMLVDESWKSNCSRNKDFLNNFLVYSEGVKLLSVGDSHISEAIVTSPKLPNQPCNSNRQTHDNGHVTTTGCASGSLPQPLPPQPSVNTSTTEQPKNSQPLRECLYWNLYNSSQYSSKSAEIVPELPFHCNHTLTVVDGFSLYTQSVYLANGSISAAMALTGLNINF